MLVNRTRETILAEEVIKAETLGTRLRGLIGTQLRENAALVISPCLAIHTWFMRHAIDILFLDGEGRVVHLVEGMRPYRISPLVFRATMVVETPAGRVAASGTRLGDRLEISNL